MFQVDIHRQDGTVGWTGTFETTAQCDAWVKQEQANGSWPGGVVQPYVDLTIKPSYVSATWSKLKKGYYR